MMAFARDEIEGSLPARFAAVVRRHPEEVALRDRGLAWTYQEADRAANLVARLCPYRHDAPPVLLLLGHGALEIIALLAVLKAGRAWVALDPGAPPARLRAIATDAGADLVLTDNRHAHLADHLGVRVERVPEAATLRAATDDPDLAHSAGHAPGVAIGADDLASLAYTSGSTGAPKGVMRSHRSSLHRCWLFQNDQRLGPGERVAHLFGCGFVAAEVDVYGALLNGATLCCYPTQGEGFAGLLAWLAAERIALFHPPPALWRQSLSTLEHPPDLPALRTVFLAGEPVYGRDIEAMRWLLPACTVVHRLSSSEASAIAQYRVGPGDPIEVEAALPVGSPVADKRLLLVDAEGREVPHGQPGEIVVESRYLSPGYWRQPDLTAERFTPVPGAGAARSPPLRRFRSGDLGRFDPTGSRLDHLGRLDAQVKIRGYRVEPREIEAALLRLDAIATAAVVTLTGPDGDNALAAFAVPRNDAHVTAAELRRHLASTLPAYMLPSRIECRPELPLTANGKIDRQALAAAGPRPPASATEPPRGHIERRIARIWSDLLQVHPVDRGADFFSLGGHSLSAARAVAQLNREFGLALALASIYQAPTVAAMALRVREASTSVPGKASGPVADLAAALAMLEEF